jgi:hypothetical protein
MHSLKQTFRPLHIIALSFCLMAFFGWSCEKDKTDYECLNCIAKYNNGITAGQREACGDEEQRKFRDEFNYADKIECK